MKTFLKPFAVSLLLLICAGAALAQTVQTDYDHNFNLNKFHTYGFNQPARRPGDPLASNPINDRRIHDALATQLSANGITASNQPDFLISYFVTTRRGIDIQDNRLGLFQRRGNINVEQVTEGTLMVIFYDAATKQEVWRGYASGNINPKDLDKAVTKSVAKLVEKFKKNQLGQN